MSKQNVREVHEATSKHYDNVTEAWRRWVMGEELHFGYFNDPNDSTSDATKRLTKKMADGAQLKPGLRILDVGCGIGTQAGWLSTTFDCDVVGISTSPIGVAEANARAKAAGNARASFVVADATGHDLPNESFDRVWVLESSHLMVDKGALLRECARVLRPGGRLVLCDIMDIVPRASELSALRMGFAEHTALEISRADEAHGERVWGALFLQTRREYEEQLKRVGLKLEASEDISEQTRPTMWRWANETAAHVAEIDALVGAGYAHSFITMCRTMVFSWGASVGYGFVAATK